MKNIITPYKTIIFVAESLFAMYTTKNPNNKGMKMFAVCNLKCKRNERTVFSNINFSLKQGEGLILKGANASGKTSLLQILSGLLKPFSGSVTWNGKDSFGRTIPSGMYLYRMETNSFTNTKKLVFLK